MNPVGKIYGLIPKIMVEVGAITKDRSTAGGGSTYKFRGIDDIYFAFQPVLSKYGVFCAPRVVQADREERLSKAGGNLIYTFLRVEFRFYADDGSYFETVVTGEAMDSSDKSANKAMSSAMKYAFLQVFCIPTEDDNDTENSHHEPLPRAASSVKPNGPVAALKPASRSGDPLGSGAFCDACNTELIKSKAGTGYYCPKFTSLPGEHTRFAVDQLEGVINQQTQARIGSRA